MNTTRSKQVVKGLPVVEVLPESAFCEVAGQIRSEIAKRAYQIFCDSGCSNGHEVEDWLTAEAQLLESGPVELKESRDEITVQTHLAGFAPEEIALWAEPRRLYITAKHPGASDTKTGESAFSRVFRTIDLPAEIDAKRTRAIFSNGVVEVILPKLLTHEELVKYAAVA